MESFKSLRSDVMVNSLYQQALQKSYLNPADLWQGVVLKKARGEYACCPPQLRHLENSFFAAAADMNVCCAMTMSTTLTLTILNSMACADMDYVPLPGGLRVQVLKKMADLRWCQLHHFAAFVEDPPVLVVWDDNVKNLLARAEDLEAKFVKVIWGDATGQTGDDPAGSSTEFNKTDRPVEKNVDTGHLEAGHEKRSVRLNCALMSAATIVLAVGCLSLGWRKLALEIKTDHHWLRLALIAVFPAQIFTSHVRVMSR